MIQIQDIMCLNFCQERQLEMMIFRKENHVHFDCLLVEVGKIYCNQQRKKKELFDLIQSRDDYEML